MYKQATTYFLTAFGILLLLASCVPQKKAVTAKKNLASVNKQLGQYQDSLQNLDQFRKNKQSQNEIDDTASARFQRFIDSTNSEIKVLISGNNVLIGDTKVSREDWDRLNKALFNSQQTSDRINKKV